MSNAKNTTTEASVAEKLSRPFYIKDVRIKNRLTLAPMAGFTDSAMRALAAEGGAGLTVTEMVSAKGLVYNTEKCGGLLITSDAEKIKCVQLFGHEPDYFREALKLDCLNKFDIIDINMGCPVPKIVKNGDGSALMKNPLLAAQIVETCAESAGARPVTVKTRIGFDADENVAVEFCRTLEKAGAAAITLHGRTRAQGYGGKSDWDTIARVADSVSVPVIGNGDVCEENIGELIDRAAAFAVGRRAIGDPWIFSRLTGETETPPVYQTLLRQIGLMRDDYGERYACVNIRKHIGYYLRGVKGGKEIKARLVSIDCVDELIAEIKKGIGQN